MRFLRWVVEAVEQPALIWLDQKVRRNEQSTINASLDPHLHVQSRIVVIGAGPGGYAAAFMRPTSACRSRSSMPSRTPAASALYRGCIPSKALLHVAEGPRRSEARRRLRRDVRRAEDRPRQAARVQGRRRQELTGGIGQLAKARKVDYIQGTRRSSMRRQLERRQTADGDASRSSSTTPSSRPARGRRCPASRSTPRVHGLDGGARPAGRAGDAARRRRRLHRPGDRHASTRRSARR